MIACVIERDKLDTAILAAPVEVRNLQVHFERLRDGRQLHMIWCKEKGLISATPAKAYVGKEGLTGFLPQDLDDNFAKFFHAHRFSGVGMCQEWLIRFRLALNLRASDHTHERDQIIGRCGLAASLIVIKTVNRTLNHVLDSSWNSLSSCAGVRVVPVVETDCGSTIPLIKSRGISKLSSITMSVNPTSLSFGKKPSSVAMDDSTAAFRSSWKNMRPMYAKIRAVSYNQSTPATAQGEGGSGETDIGRSSRRLRESGGFPRSLVL